MCVSPQRGRVRAVEDKTTQDGVLVGDEPIQDGGFELFHRQDDLFLSPEEVLDLDPAPVVGNYR